MEKRQADFNQHDRSRSQPSENSNQVVSTNTDAKLEMIFSSETILQDEDLALLTTFSRNLKNELQPHGQIESLLVDLLVAFLWRLRRIHKLEAKHILNYYINSPLQNQGLVYLAVNKAKCCWEIPSLNSISKHEASLIKQVKMLLDMIKTADKRRTKM
jgi:hypothetical protein